uniref:Uncharacterized protein n=1 Tax=Physcomitrium patens TaxID=3218 RepID=A0A2K1KBC5_PHYPA|nr:hypothetical protein PHYPA_010260 [Physcomitrium patens]
MKAGLRFQDCSRTHRLRSTCCLRCTIPGTTTSVAATVACLVSSKAYKSDGERGGEEKEKLKRRERETPPPPLRNLQVEERKGKEKGRKEGTEPKKKGMKERMKRKEGRKERNGKEKNEGKNEKEGRNGTERKRKE